VSMSRRYFFLSGNLGGGDESAVLTQIVTEFASEVEPATIHLSAPEMSPDSAESLQRLGIHFTVSEPTATRLRCGRSVPRGEDFVFLNTLDVPASDLLLVLRRLRRGRLEHAYLLNYEGSAGIPRLTGRGELAKNLRRLVVGNRLTLLVPSPRLKAMYDAALGIDRVRVLSLRPEGAGRSAQPRPPGDYDVLHFVLPGPGGDGRFGQMLAIFAFQHFHHHHLARQPRDYREFSLTLTGLGDDYVSRQIQSVAASVLGERLRIHPAAAIETGRHWSEDSNAIISCRVDSGFPFAVMRAMASGHIVFLNDASGLSEYFKDGLTGFCIATGDTTQFSQALEEALNREKTTTGRLAEMGRASQVRIGCCQRNSYVGQLLDTRSVGQGR
jgi:Glycosyl transferases group 1